MIIIFEIIHMFLEAVMQALYEVFYMLTVWMVLFLISVFIVYLGFLIYKDIRRKVKKSYGFSNKNF